MSVNITLRVRDATPAKLREIAKELRLPARRSSKVGKGSISRLLDYLADNPGILTKGLDKT